MIDFLRRTWAEVDIDAVKHNFKEIRRTVGDDTEIMCVIKADGYGQDAIATVEIAKKLLHVA